MRSCFFMRLLCFHLFLFLALRPSMALINQEAGLASGTANVSSRKGELRLANIFRDGAVLQREMPIPVWGHTAPGSRIRITMGNDIAHTVANPTDGYFFLRLPAHPAADGLTMTAEDLDTGETLRLKDLAVGEVYIAAGQSNMAFWLLHCQGGKEAIADCADTALRFYKVQLTAYPGEQRDCPGTWIKSSPETMERISGVAYFFARKLRRELQVPVGIVLICRGGINIESFVSRSDLLLHPYYTDELLKYDAAASAANQFTPDGKLCPSGEKLEKGFQFHFPKLPVPAGKQPAEAAVDHDDSTWQQLILPASWTLGGHNHAGIFWFRKEVFLPENADCNAEWTLGLGAVDKADETYVNGKFIGATGNARDFSNWNKPRLYQLPPGTLKPGRNVIAVRAASMISIATDGGLIGPADKMFLAGSGHKFTLTGCWRYCEAADYGTIGMTFMRTMGAGEFDSFHMVYDNSIKPLAPYAMRGAIFYQGEANAICMAHTYQELLKLMIGNWRRIWAQPKFDFIIFQLPEYGTRHSYTTYSQWARIREAQLNAAIQSNAALTVTMGYGDTNDIHPPKKLEVSEFAAMQAIRLLDGKNTTPCHVKSAETSGNTVRITFSNSISAAEPASAITGFVIAGKDGVVYPADARITGKNTVTVSATQVKTPVCIWYNWSDHPDAANQLLDENRMPVSPFRTSTGKDTIIPNALPANNIPMM